MEVTEDELLAEIQALLEKSESENETGTITTPELIAQFHIGYPRAKILLESLIESRVLVRDRVLRVDPWGGHNRVKGYRYASGSKS